MFDISGLSLDINDRSRWVAIIGSRGASKQEHDAAYRLAYTCAKRGDIIVSGLAKNIDTAAHYGALAAGGLTVAIISTPKGEIYPKDNFELASLIQSQGCIVHPFKEKTQDSIVFKHRLIERDILVAKLCPVICVTSDSEKPINGGTRWALTYGKEYKRKVYRVDSNLKFYENPETKKCILNWNMELDIKKY